MRAVEIQRAGELPVVVHRESPLPGEGEVLVELAAAPLTPLDVLCAGGRSYFGSPQVPYVPGVQGVGRVGGKPYWFPTSAGMRPGDGSMAGIVAVPDQDLVSLPDDVDLTLMAALGLSAVAAHLALSWRGGLVAGEQVIVLGAGGVVGQAAVQLARLGGARRVVGAARSEAAQARARAAGAHDVVVLDTDDVSDLARRFEAALDGAADLVLDPLWGAPAAAAAAVLATGGRLVNLGSSAGETSPLTSSVLRSRSLRVLGYTNNELSTRQRAEAVRHIADLAAQGRLAVAHEALDFDTLARGWERQTSGAVDGRLVLVPGPHPSAA
ncbi:MAG: zinc-binding alcohol dehydrogenase family protein [Propionibacteriaceae bacterium]